MKQLKIMNDVHVFTHPYRGERMIHEEIRKAVGHHLTNHYCEGCTAEDDPYCIDKICRALLASMEREEKLYASIKESLSESTAEKALARILSIIKEHEEEGK